MPHGVHGSCFGYKANAYLTAAQWRIFRTPGHRYEVWLFDNHSGQGWEEMGEGDWPMRVGVSYSTVDDARREAQSFEDDYNRLAFLLHRGEGYVRRHGRNFVGYDFDHGRNDGGDSTLTVPMGRQTYKVFGKETFDG